MMAEDVSTARATPQQQRPDLLMPRVPLALPPLVARLSRFLGRRFPPGELMSFGTIGAICTLLFLLIYDVARPWLPPLGANVLALTSTAGLNFAANRWLTFRTRSGRLLNQALQYFVFYAVGLGASSLALFSFLMLWSQPPHSVELVAALASSGLATAVRYVAMTVWVFPQDRPADGQTPSTPSLDPEP